MYIAGNPTNCPNSDGNEYGDLYQSLKCSYNYHIDDFHGIMILALANVSYMKCSYNYHIDDCHGIMILALANVSYMSIFNDFD